MVSLTLHPSGANCLEIYMTIDNFTWLYTGRQLASHCGQVTFSPTMHRHQCEDDACTWEGTNPAALVEHKRITDHESVDSQVAKLDIVVTVTELQHLAARGCLQLACACVYLIEPVKFLFTLEGGLWFSASRHHLMDSKSPPLRWVSNTIAKWEQERNEMALVIMRLEYDKFVLKPRVQKQLKGALEREAASEKIMEEIKSTNRKLFEDLEVIQLAQLDGSISQTRLDKDQKFRVFKQLAANQKAGDDEIAALKKEVASLCSEQEILISHYVEHESKLEKMTTARAAEMKELDSMREEVELRQEQSTARIRECEERISEHAKEEATWAAELQKVLAEQNKLVNSINEEKNVLDKERKRHLAEVASHAGARKAQDDEMKNLRLRVDFFEQQGHRFGVTLDDNEKESFFASCEGIQVRGSKQTEVRNREIATLREKVKLLQEDKDAVAREKESSKGADHEVCSPDQYAIKNQEKDHESERYQILVDIRDLKKEMENQAAASAANTTHFQDRIKQLEAENKGLVAKHDELFLKLDTRTAQIAECNDRLEAERSRNEIEKENLRAEHTKVNNEWNTVSRNRRSEKIGVCSECPGPGDTFTTILQCGPLLEDGKAIITGEIQEKDLKRIPGVEDCITKGMRGITITGMRVQARIIANAREGLVDKGKTPYKRDPATHAVIEAGNEAAHRACYLSHFTMKYMGLLTADQHKTFLAMYRIHPDSPVVLSEKMVEVMDEIGTVAAVSPRIKFKSGSASQKLHTEFQGIASELCNMRDAMKNKSGDVLREALKQFDRKVTESNKLDRMKAISNELRKLDKERNREACSSSPLDQRPRSG